ncbi:MAG: oligosaccharide flippase family protein [Candidatus Electryonea clarkiae]|nr:oligosaccharide flippase family protein [Candidatus Electryonea clarkiae]MDP8285061.1 oligosaccharide flippase family protein [Candidatus Electryonea clarkiae]
MNGLIIKLKGLLERYKVYYQSASLYLLPTVIMTAVKVVTNPFMARNLSPEDYAVMGYFSSFIIIFQQILNFSVITYFLANYYKIPEKRRQIVSDTILIALLVYGFVALVVLYAVFYFYSRWSEVSLAFFPYALLTYAPIYFTSFMTLYLVKCRLTREAGKFSKLTIFNGLFSVILAILLVIIYKFGATGALLSGLIASVITGAYCFKQLFGKFQFDFTVIKDAFHFGWPLSLLGILTYFSTGIDRAMLERLNDTYTLGFYSVGLQMGGYFMLFYSAIAQTFEPDIYKAIAEDNKRKLAKIIAGIVSLNAIPNIIFIVFAPLIIGLLTYGRYTDASSFAQILALKNITVSIAYSIGVVVVGYGYNKSALVIGIFKAALFTVMFKFMISHFGFYGAAWGQVLSYVIAAFLSIILLFFKFKYYRIGVFKK